jgi:hypothetical protein
VLLQAPERVDIWQFAEHDCAPPVTSVMFT